MATTVAFRIVDDAGHAALLFKTFRAEKDPVGELRKPILEKTNERTNWRKRKWRLKNTNREPRFPA